MKTTLFYLVTFMGFFNGNLFNGNVESYFTLQLLLYRQ